MKVKVPLWRTSPTQAVTIDPAATVGAQFGVNLTDPDGKLVPWPLAAPSAPGGAPAPGSTTSTTDDLQEGRYNLYFTTGRASAAAPIQSLVPGTNVTIDTTDPRRPVINAAGGGVGTGTFPFFLSDLTRANISLNGSGELPFFLADGSASDIPLAA